LKMGYGKCGWVMAKGKEIKRMRKWGGSVPDPECSGFGAKEVVRRVFGNVAAVVGLPKIISM
jgi:hypothetical protein